MALYIEVTLRSFASGDPTKVLNTGVTERSVSLKKKKSGAFEVLSAVGELRRCFSLAGCEARTAPLFSDKVFITHYI